MHTPISDPSKDILFGALSIAGLILLIGVAVALILQV